MLRKILRYSIPPILISLYRRIRSYSHGPHALFDGDDRLFKKVMKGAKTYGEYGCGRSTKWVLNNTSANVMAVDTSQHWVEKTRNDNAVNRKRLNIKHADLGEVGDWGCLADYSKRDSFHVYTDFLWQQEENPNVVLVDGRFRVCCFLTSLKFAAEGTCILFDDYITRPEYHVVEEYVERVEECGRQCLFVVPPDEQIDFDALEKDIHAFRHVMD